jgi:hypothetical protein
VTLDLDLGVEELVALEPHLLHRMRAIRVRLRHGEVRHRWQIQFDVCFLDLGLGSLELVLGAAGACQEREGYGHPHQMTHGPVIS